MARLARLFDLDGTLWDSFPWYEAVLSQRGGLVAGEIERRLAAGASVMRLIDELGVSRTAFRQLAEDHADRIRGFDGAQEVMRALRARGVATAVVTSVPGWLAEIALKRLGLFEYMESVISASSGRGRKPGPGPVLGALEEIGLAPSRDHVYIGDGVNDALAARRAGVRFAWASWGYGAVDDADVVLASLGEVLAL
jgi:HAD superfamily hydrolase (TIGR01549 family)